MAIWNFHILASGPILFQVRSTFSDNAGHGDWLIDEIRLSDRNLVHHEILFNDGNRWLIESKDIKISWLNL